MHQTNAYNIGILVNLEYILRLRSEDDIAMDGFLSLAISFIVFYNNRPPGTEKTTLISKVHTTQTAQSQLHLPK